MNAQQVAEQIQRALDQFDGDELDLMEALAPIAEGWRMRLQELQDEQDG